LFDNVQVFRHFVKRRGEFPKHSTTVILR